MGAGRVEPLADVNVAIAEAGQYIASLWSYPDLGNDVTIDRSSAEIALGTRRVRFPALFMLDERNSVNDIRFAFNGDTSLTEVVRDFAQPNRFLWIDDCAEIAAVHPKTTNGSDETCALIDAGADDLRWYAPLPDQVSILTDDLLAPLAEITDAVQFHPVMPFVAEATPPEAREKAREQIHIRSAGFGHGESYLEDDKTGQRVTLQRGISVIGRRNDEAELVLLGHVDRCTVEGQAEDLEADAFEIKNYVANRADGFELLFVVVHDSAFCMRDTMADIFAGTEFQQGKNIDFREPYIGILRQNDGPFEVTGPTETAITLETFAMAEKE